MADLEYLVTDHFSGLTFTCRAGETLLSAAIRSGSQLIRVGCRAGGCGLCKVQVLDGQFNVGKMSRAHISEAEERQGFVLACRTLPVSALEFRSRIDACQPETGELGVRT